MPDGLAVATPGECLVPDGLAVATPGECLVLAEGRTDVNMASWQRREPVVPMEAEICTPRIGCSRCHTCLEAWDALQRVTLEDASAAIYM